MSVHAVRLYPRLVSLGLLALLAGALLAAPPSLGSRSSKTDLAAGSTNLAAARLFGVHQDLLYYGSAQSRARFVAVAGSLGARVSRSSFLWHRLESTKGRRKWSPADNSVDALVRAGIEPLMVVVGSPRWANGSSDPFAVPITPKAFKRWIDRYRTFMRDAVRRYRGRVHYWEIWNEPNEGFFWKPQPVSASRYTAFYQAIRRVILKEDPAARVAVGGLAGLVFSCCISGEDFLRQMISAGALIDNVAVHAYSSHAPDRHVPWEANFDDIQAIRDLLDAAGRPNVGLWLTEWGWATPPLDLETQETFVRQSLELLRDRYSYVELATYFIDVDRRGAYSHGLFDASLQVKPAGRAFAAFVATQD